MARLRQGLGHRSAQALQKLGSHTTTGFPFRRARSGTVARTCRVVPRHTVAGNVAVWHG